MDILNSYAGFDRLMTFEDVNDDSIYDIQKFVQTKLPILLKNSDEETRKSFFGEYSANPEKFEYCSKDRSLILKCAKYATYVTSIENINSNFKQLHVEDSGIHEIAASECSTGVEKANSRTHYFLSLLLAEADKNIQRKKEGYRFDETIKKLASYYRMVAGPLAYETL